MISRTLSKIIEDKRGYRTESYSGSGVRNLKEILRYEIVILGNTDILAYLRDNYDILPEFKLNENTISSLRETAEDDNELKQLIIDEEQQIAIVNADYFIEQILNFVQRVIGSKEATGLWLTTFKNVINRYGGNSEDIDEYSLPDRFIVLSDLDNDGALLVFKKDLN